MRRFLLAPWNWLGFFLSLSHLVSFYHFQFSGGRSLIGRLFDGQPPICYPLLPSCADLRPWLQENLTPVLALYVCLTLVSAAVFLGARTAAWRWVLLAPLALKMFLQFQDQTLGGNFHLIGYLLHGAFLLARDPVRAMKMTLFMTYFGAGLLKIDAEWLSGSLLLSLGREYPGILSPALEQAEFRQLAVFAPMVFELIIAWGLLAGGRLYAFAALAAVAFHLSSIFFIGRLFAMFMAFYLPVLWIGRKQPLVDVDGWKWRMDPGGWLAPLVLVALHLPHIAHGSERSLTSPWRFYALNMLDTQAQCTSFALARFQRETYDIGFGRARLSPRSRCDVQGYRSIASHYCREFARRGDFKGIHWALHGRRSHDPTVVRIEEHAAFCLSPEDR